MKASSEEIYGKSMQGT